MRRSLCLLFLLPVFAFAQRTYTPDEINRLADLGRLWGILHYFHPAMADGSITTESLVVDNAASLANDPSAENFKKVVGNMLGKLNDPSTRIYIEPGKKEINLFTPRTDSLVIHRLPDGVLYIACPVSAIVNPNLFERKELAVSELVKSKGVIFDLRSKNGYSRNNDLRFTEAFAKKYLGSLVNEQGLKAVYDAYIQHDGFVSQMYRHGNIYGSGWKYRSDSDIYETDYTVQKLNVPIAFVVNGDRSTYMLTLSQSLQYAGKCAVIYEGDALVYPNKLLSRTDLSDSLIVLSKSGYNVIGNNYLVPMPDKLVPYVQAGNDFMEECSRFLLSFNPAVRKDQSANVEYVHPKPSKNSTLFASTGERLLGLYNYWNAIRYFFPSKQLAGNNWDSILHQYIPVFINAIDTFKYYLAICSLTSEIHDSHGSVGIAVPANRNIIVEKFFYLPPILVSRVGDKVYIIDKQNDSLKSENPVQLWDEIIKVNGIPTIQYIEKFRKYFSSSNETGYYKYICNFLLLSGEKNTNAQFTIKRGEKTFDISMKRTSNRAIGLSDTIVNFSVKNPVSKVLPGNIGYVNMRYITTDQIDSIMNDLWNTRAIIFDVRNYPRGTAWNLAAYLTDKPVVTQFNKYMQVSYRTIAFEGNDRFEGNNPLIMPRKDKKKYVGRAIVLCNELSQSHAEYSVMILQIGGRATVVGSQTMGADGNVSEIYFPGGYHTYFSALGVYYPDGSETQRVGVKIDIQCKPTLKGLKAGRDEVLERAIRFINTGK